MNVWPVITRELRTQARQRFTYGLRMLGVVALLGAGFVFSLNHPFASSLGGALFGYLHFTLFCAIWILVPLGAADCISRERREGTLGLLFLTPLKPEAIVIAKGIAHGLRAMTLLIAVLPVLTIPFLLGGVSWQLATMSALIHFSAICWALAAALVASAISKSGLRAMVGAVLLALCTLYVFAVMTGILVMPGIVRSFGFSFSQPSDYSISNPSVGFEIVSLRRINWAVLLRIAPASDWLICMAKVAGISALALLAGISVAARSIRRNWRDEPPPLWVRKSQRAFLTPVVMKKFFRRWLKWKLDRNPLGWLEQRTWIGRLITWSWFAVVVSLYSAVLTDKNFFRQDEDLQAGLAWLLMGSIAASVAASFRRERESGVLELLLVTPLTTGQIIGGRLRGLWGQFLPAVVTLLGLWTYLTHLFDQRVEYQKIFFFFTMFLTLPVIGLYFSVRSRSYLGAFLTTLFFSMILPQMLGLLTHFLLGVDGRAYRAFSRESWCSLRAVFFQLLFAAWFGALLYRRLEKRNFPMERALA